MPFPWQIATSSAAGAVITLVGVFAGVALSSRTQRRHWARDRQIEACANILAESTSIQLALVRRWKRGDRVDWVAWNQALAAIWLVGEPDVVDAALRVDKTFWKQSMRIKRGEMVDEETWAEARDLMEADRLNFINAARIHVMKIKTRLTSTPIGRPPLSEVLGSREPAQSAVNPAKDSQSTCT